MHIDSILAVLEFLASFYLSIQNRDILIRVKTIFSALYRYLNQRYVNQIILREYFDWSRRLIPLIYVPRKYLN